MRVYIVCITLCEPSVVLSGWNLGLSTFPIYKLGHSDIINLYIYSNPAGLELYENRAFASL